MGGENKYGGGKSGGYEGMVERGVWGKRVRVRVWGWVGLLLEEMRGVW